MYKWVLCWRYLRTRYLALACIVSVMLGVATLIVVNSVMAGFSTKLRERLHGLLSDIVIESQDLDGFSDYEGKLAAIRNDPFLSERIVAMTPTLEVFAMLHWKAGSVSLTRPVRSDRHRTRRPGPRRRLRGIPVPDRKQSPPDVRPEWRGVPTLPAPKLAERPPLVPGDPFELSEISRRRCRTTRRRTS